MNENLDLCEILKDCPKGTKLWSSCVNNKNTVETLNEDILKAQEKLFELREKRDKACAEELYKLVGRCFKYVGDSVFEIIKVKKICVFDEVYTIKATYLKYYIFDFDVDECFVYYSSFDIPLYSDGEDSIREFNENYKEISEEEFNSLLKESFNTYSKHFSNETV